MPLLPAVVPPRPSHTATPPTPERLARNVAPLFGVPWPEGPFHQRTWACDYGRITLSEIARGAPLPTRTKARELSDDPPATKWRLVERVAVTGPGTPLPHEIPNATLTRFGPDTKAAVVLVAVNELLAPVTDAVHTALSLLVGADATLSVELRLAAWAGLVLETFRSQPALVAAAIRARTIQRELAAWELPLADELTGVPLTRCEISAQPGKSNLNDQPRTLDVADRTFGVLQLPAEDGNSETPTDDPSSRGLARRMLREEAVDVLLRRLLATGTPDDASHLWLSEREPSQLAVEAFIPPTALVGEFVRHAMRSLDLVKPLSVTGLPRVPEPAELAALDDLARRCVLIGLMSMLRQVQHSPEARELNRLDMVAPLRAIGDLTRSCLPPDDPVAVLTRCRVADMTVHMLRHDRRNELRPPLDGLRWEVQRVHELAVKGVIDRGAAAEAISSANVEINAVRWTNAADPGSGLPSPDELHAELRTNWKHFHHALELGSPATLRAAGYHLHNYASFLASPVTTGSTHHPDVARAVRLFADVVIPARAAFCARTGSFQPLRISLQIASRAAARLAEEALADGDVTTAAHFADLGREWVHRALAEDETERMLAAYPPTERALRFALLTAPVLLLAAEIDAAGATSQDLATARRLVEVAQAWERSVMGGNAKQYPRHEELLALAERLDALTIRSAP